MKIMLLVIILLTLTACTSLEGSHKQNIVYTSSAYENWHGAIMNKCAQESVKLTLKIYEGQLEEVYDVQMERYDRRHKEMFDEEGEQ